MAITGAGGTHGGIGRFFLGLLMILIGGYLLLSSIIVTNHFHLGYGLFHFGGFGVTSGLILIPFMFGIGMIFFNCRSVTGWLLAAGSVLLLIVGVIASIEFRLRSMTAFELLLILALLVGGIGLFANSLREQ